LVEITGGLKAGESVIVQGQQGLPDGAGIVAAK
jgi:multidrug efflux pump subunit AcrA (membrane-fusion protein)